MLITRLRLSARPTSSTILRTGLENDERQVNVTSLTQRPRDQNDLQTYNQS